MSFRGDLTRLIDPLCLIIIAPLHSRSTPPRPTPPRRVAVYGYDTLPHLFRRRDLTQIAFLKSITAGGNSAAALNFYYRIRFRAEPPRRVASPPPPPPEPKIHANNFDVHERLSLINVPRDRGS